MPLRLAIEKFLIKLPTRALATFAFLGVIALAAYGDSDQGYARASTVRELRIGNLEERIFMNRVLQCSATGPLRQAYAEKVGRMLREYLELGGRAPPPTCEELGL